MSNTSSNELSATIANMMDILNPRLRRKSELRTPFDFPTPPKRHLSCESLETPDKRARTSNSPDVSWVASPRETNRLRADLVEARSLIVNLENRIKNMHGVRKELQLLFDNEIQSFQHQHERDRKTVEDLETQMQTIRKREQEAKDELHATKNTINLLKVEYENKIEELEIKVGKLKSEQMLNESQEDDEITGLQNRVEELEMLLDAAQKDAQAQKELAMEFETRLSKLTTVERQMELKEQVLLKTQMKIKDLEYTLESYGEWQQQSKIQQRKLIVYPELEKETQKLRDEVKNLQESVKNKLILEEEVHDLKTRMEKTRNLEKKLATLETSHSHLENLVEEWRQLAREICETNVPDVMLPKQIRQYIEKFQQQEVSLTTEKLQAESQFKQNQHELKQVKSELDRTTKQLVDMQTSQQQHQALVHRLKKKLELVRRERDSYRQQLDTYERDLTVNIDTTDSARMEQKTLQDRINHLEKIVDGYRELISNLENELQKYQPHLNTDNIAPVRIEQTARLQEKLEKLQSENSRLTERCDELEIQLERQLNGKDTGKGQVLHLQMNPLSECIAEKEANVDKLQTEIDRLKRKIRSMEDGLETSKLSQTMCSSQEVKTLREQLNLSEVKMQRLKDCFKTSTQEFRNACYTLFGYKIDKNYEQYTLSSMYAETSDDCLQFQMNTDGNFDLLETPFSATLDQMVDLHLHHQASIPVFLSAVTMDLFNRTTMTNM